MLGSTEIVLLFAAFCVVAGLISKHLTQKHERSLKQAELGNASATGDKSIAWGGLVFVVVGFTLSLGLPILLLPITFVATDNATDVPIPDRAFDPSVEASSKHLSQNQLAEIKNWDEDLPFEADLYPGIEACAAPLAAKIAKKIKADQATSEEVPITLFVGNSGMQGSWWYGGNFGTFLTAFKKAIKSEMPSVTFLSQAGNKNYTLNFNFDDLRMFTESRYYGSISLKSGKIVCRSKELEGKPLSVSFSEKPWLTHPNEFMSKYPNVRFYIGATNRVQPLRSKAHDRVVQDLANQLDLRAEQIEARIFDRFSQAIERPYGKVFREAILVCDPPRTTAAKQLARLGIAHSFSSEFLLAMMVCLTVVAGFVSNIATQGYYRTKISNLAWVGLAFLAALILVNIILIVVD